MSTPLVLFRCDASLIIGSGHVMRCHTLACALNKRGADVVFFCRRQPGDLISMLEKSFEVVQLPAPKESSPQPRTHDDSLSGRELYRSWLGSSEEQDAAAFLGAFISAGLRSPDWLILDHYALGAIWQQCVQTSLLQQQARVPSVLVLDDLADRHHYANVLIDANRVDAQHLNPYSHLVSASCTTLLGPAYALLAPLYSSLQPLLPTRVNLCRILVFFGGADVSNYCSVALQALSHPRLLHIAVDVVLGHSAPHRFALEKSVSIRPNTTLHVGLPSLAGLMARADLAVGAAGTASWERACLGLPALVVPIAHNQQFSASALQAAGVARCLNIRDSYDPVEALQLALLDLLDAPDALQQMSEACMQLGDGRGVARVVTALLGPAPSMRLRPARFSDLWLYHWWANDPDVRQQSFNSNLIPLTEHRSWFIERLNSTSTLLRVLEDGDGLPLGQIRFERFAQNDSLAVIGFSLDRLARGRGLGLLLLELGLAELERYWGPGCEAYAEVRSENHASCRTFVRAGFEETPSSKSGVRCFLRAAHS
jgi:UDP-2,4-diacetamido-2,4,6-trideoxy-beta-L-altropyranose hydrolase